MGPLTRFCRSVVDVEYVIGSDSISVRESLPPNYINPSCPAEVSLIQEFRYWSFVSEVIYVSRSRLKSDI